METAIALLAIVVVIAAVVVAGAIKIVPVHHIGVVERLGRYQRLIEPGLRMVVPFIDTVRKIDTREQTTAVPAEEVMTTDNMLVSTAPNVRYRITDPYKALYGVANIPLALIQVVQTTLRNAIGGMDLDEALSSPYKMQANMLEILREAAEAWGVEVMQFELKDLTYRPVARS